MTRSSFRRSEASSGGRASSVLIAALAASGCATEQRPTASRVVIPLGPARPASSEPADVGPSIAAVEKAFEGGDIALAARLLEEIPLAALKPQDREAYTRIRIAVRRAQIRELYLSAETLTDSPSLTLGDPLSVRLEIENHADVPIYIATTRATGFLGLGQGEEAVVDLAVDYFEYDRQGSRYESSWHLRLPVREDLDLDPGEQFRWEVPVDAGGDTLRPERVVYRRLVVRPTLWALSIRIGDSTYLAPIPFRPLTIEVLPPGAAALKGDPETALTKALQARGRADVANHVFFAAIFLLGQDRDRAAAILADALEPGDPETRAAAVAALRVATGAFEHDDPVSWRGWCANRLAEAR